MRGAGARRSRSRSSTARGRSSTRRSGRSRTSCSCARSRPRRRPQRAGRAARKVAQGQGRSKAEQDKAAKSAEQVVYAGLLKELLQINLQVRARPDRRAAAQRPQLRLRAGLRPQPRRRRRRRRASPTCSRTADLVGDPGAPQADADRRAAPRRDHADPRGRGDAAVEARQGRATPSRARRWCSRTSPDALAGSVAAAAGGRARRDGARARARVPQPPADRAAAGRARPPWRSRSARWRSSARR